MRKIIGVVLSFFFLTFLSNAQPKMSAKEIVSKMNEHFNANEPELAMGYFADSLQKAGVNGRSFLMMMNDDILATFPDVQTKILEMWQEGDWVIARCEFSGTHKGIASLPHHGGLLIGKEPSNKRFAVQHIRMYKVIDGKIVARQAVRDDLLMYQQLGLIEAPPSFKPSPKGIR